MKKVILLVVIFFTTAPFSFGVITDTQVANFILQNHNCNLNDPNKIYPGQWLLFNFGTEDMAFVRVKKGENLYGITRRVLVQNEKKLKQITLNAVLKEDPLQVIQSAKKPSVSIMERKTPDKGCPWNTIPVWCWVGVSFLLFVISLDFFIDDQKQKKKK